MKPLAQRPSTGVAFRYLVASGINVVIHQSVLQVAVRLFGWRGGPANVLAAFIVLVPAYFISRSWVWRSGQPATARGELLPFLLISLVGLVLSTVLSAAADALFTEPLLISVGSLIGYVLAWIAKFLALDRLFSRWNNVDRPAKLETR